MLLGFDLFLVPGLCSRLGSTQPTNYRFHTWNRPKLRAVTILIGVFIYEAFGQGHEYNF